MSAKGKKPKNRKSQPPDKKGGNQWVADPRQQLFLAYYLDPKSKTFSNAYQSAMAAGFEENYAAVIMRDMPDWLSEKLGNMSPMLLKAERNLIEALDFPTMSRALTPFAPMYEKVEQTVTLGNGKKVKKKVKVPVMIHNVGVIDKKLDISKFIAKTVGRSKYSEKLSGDGDIYNIVILNDEQRVAAAREILTQRSSDI